MSDDALRRDDRSRTGPVEGGTGANQWVAEFVAANADGVFLADENGVVVEVNDAWTRMIGYGRSGIPYAPPYPWWPDAAADPEARAQLDAALTHLLGEGSGAYEVPLQHRDGRRVWTSMSVTSVFDPRSGRPLLVGTVRDVTEQRRIRKHQQDVAALARSMAEGASSDAVLALLADGLGAVFGARVDVAPGAVEPAADRPWADAGAEPDALVPQVGAVLRTEERQWRVVIVFDQPRRVSAEDHLLLGLLTTAAGAALQRIETELSQQAVNAGLRQAAADAAQEARTWRAEAALRDQQVRAERRFRSLVEAVNAVVWSRGPDGTVGEPQPSFAAWTGQQWPDHSGRGWLEMIHVEDRDRVAALWREVAVTDESREVRHRLWHAGTGGYRYVVSRAVAIRDEHGTVTEWLETITDIHDQVTAEQAEQHTAAVIDAILHASPVGFGWADQDLRLQHVNPALCRINGLDGAAHVGHRPAELWGEQGRHIEDLMRKAMADGPVTGVEFAVPDGDTGGALHRVASYVPIRIAGSTRPVGVGFTIVDVTERTRLLEALGAERARYEQLAATDVLAVFGGVDDRITEANDAFLTMLGHTRDDLDRGALQWRDLTPPGWAEADERSLVALATTGRARAFPKEYLHADGHRVPVLIGVVALEREPLRWLAYAADLTAERSAQAESRLFQALVERSGDLVAVAGADGVLRYLNPAGQQMIGGGTRPAQLTDLADEPELPKWRDTIVPVVDGTSPHRTETRLTRRDAETPVDVDLQAFTVAGDTVADPLLAVVARDITQRQRSLRQAHSLASIAAALSTASDTAEVLAAVQELAPTVLEARTVTIATPDDPRPPSHPDTPHHLTPLRPRTDGSPAFLNVHWEDGREAVDEARLSLVHTVADLTSQAMQRTQLIAAAATMARLAARLSVTRTPPDAVDVILDTAPNVLGANTATLAVRETGDRVRLHTRDRAATTHDTVALADVHPTVTAVRTGRRVVPTDAGAQVTLPLHDSDGRPVAALTLGWPQARPFDAADLAALDTVADLCEQTLERTRLVAAEHELITRLAARLHHTGFTVPAQLDVARRYRPAMTGLNIGGDWHDLIPLPGGRLAVVVGDVVGHHIEAAADMAQMRTVLNTLVRLDVPLEELFARFTTLQGRGFWGTAVVILLDPAGGRADVVGAGHPPPALVRPGSPPRTVALERTPPLGLVQRACTVTSVPLEPGDTLVAFTDGLVERRDATYDDGLARLYAGIAATAPHSTADDLATVVLAAAPTGEDDQALVIVRLRPPDDRTLLYADFTADDISGLRHTVRRCAGDAGLIGPRLDDFTIAIYELLTNAVRHGAGAGRLHLRTAARTLLCHVGDDGPGLPTTHHDDDTQPQPDAVGGRGLWLTRRLADEVYLSPAATGGTTATAVMRLS